jgi:hypothetical protein
MKKAKTPKKLPYKGWTPMKDGVSQSLLQKFVVDRDRFHRHAVEGLREIDRKEAMEYGTIFHKLIELGAQLGNKYTRDKLLVLMSKYLKNKFNSPESLLLCKIAIAQYHLYREWEMKRERYRYIDQEPVFCEPFKLPAMTFQPNEDIMIRIPSNTIIPLRGRIDEVIEKNGMWIQENKTKSRINISQVQDTLHCNIQVMFYAVCAELKYGRPCKGVIYNVIRKPGEKQHQKENERDYIQRITERIQNDMEYYFYRLKYEFQPGQVDKWKREELIPLLYQVYIWWRSIEKNPLNPWEDENGVLNPFHGRRSFGIYDSMSQGKGDFYDLIVYGRRSNLTKTSEVFPELQEEDDD